jgi:hypothetical protein
MGRQEQVDGSLLTWSDRSAAGAGRDEKFDLDSSMYIWDEKSLLLLRDCPFPYHTQAASEYVRSVNKGRQTFFQYLDKDTQKGMIQDYQDIALNYGSPYLNTTGRAYGHLQNIPNFQDEEEAHMIISTGRSGVTEIRNGIFFIQVREKPTEMNLLV